MATGDLTTLNNVKAYLNSRTNEDDQVLEWLITAASAWIKNYVSRDLLSQSYAWNFSGKNTLTVLFPEYPVTAVASVVIDGMTIPASASVNQFGYAFDDHGLYLRGYRFTKGTLNVAVGYTAGYATVPTDLDQACAEIAAWRYKERQRIGVSNKSIQGENTSFQTKDLPEHVATILQSWKKVVPV